MFQRPARKTLLLTTCLISVASTSAQASSVTFSGEFGAKSDKIFFHGTTTELLPTDLPLNIIYVTSTGAAAGGFATSITYSEPTGVGPPDPRNSPPAGPAQVNPPPKAQ